MFSDFAVWYLFFAGTAAGSFVIAAALDYFGNSFANMRFVSLASRVGFCGAPVLLGIAALMLFLDLGNPAAIVFTFLNPVRSLVSIGAWLIALALVVFLMVVALLLLRVRCRCFRLLEVIGSIIAVGLMCYTGVLLASMNSVDFWNTPLLVALFVFSALSCGCGFLSAVAFCIQGSARGFSCLRWVGVVLCVIEAVSLVALLIGRWLYSEASRQSCSMLLFGEWADVFWVGLVLCGIVVPLVLACFERHGFAPALRLVDGCSVLVGGACLRFCIIGVALYSAPCFVVS